MGKKNIASSDTPQKQRKKISAKVIVIIITLLAVLATAITASVLIIVDAVKKDKWFDYVKSDLSKYVELSQEDYKNYDLELSIAKPHFGEKGDSISVNDVDVAILNLISSEAYRKLEGDGAFVSNLPVTAGDKVSIRYRGYTINEKGEEVTVSTAMSNIQFDYDTEIQIGEDNSSFLPVGFELGLIDKHPADYAKFEKIKNGKPQGNWVVYVSFERLLDGGDPKKDTIKFSNMRIDLEDPEANTIFGDGFTEKLKGFDIGSIYNNIATTIGGKNYTYNNLLINFATTCEKASTSENGKAPLVVEGYFPYDFGVEGTATAGLRDKKVYYQVFIQGVQAYETPEFNDEFILKVIKEKGSEITEEELRAYEGATLVDKYKAYAKELINEAYEEAYDIMVEDAMWNHYLAKAKILKYPQIKVDEIYDEYVEDVYYQYDYNGGSLQDSEGNFTNYETVDEFAIAYLQLTEEDDWKETLLKMSEDLVKERLILFYIMQKEDIVPSSEVLSAKVEEIKNEYYDEYIKQYLDYQKKTEADFTPEEYQKFLEERKAEIFDYYDDDYFEETAYYEMTLEKIREYPTVYTLNNPKPSATK